MSRVCLDFERAVADFERAVADFERAAADFERAVGRIGTKTVTKNRIGTKT